MFLFDVDNTLFDNNSAQAHLKDNLEQAYGVAARAERSGLWRAVDDRVLIYIHKECELEVRPAALSRRSLRAHR